MSDSDSSEDLNPDWIPYSRRKEWADVTPLEQDDGDNPVVVISYSEKFREVYDYFRAIIASSEKSERALELTKDALKLNAANYTVWQYRRDILKALGSDLYNELEYVGNTIRDNPKNYQVWYHRRVIVEWLNDPSQELELTESILNVDAKNYHAWQHRQWVIKTFDLFEKELNYVDRLLTEDLWNNSAWNQRFFVLKHYGFTPEVIEREIHYAMNRIRKVKNNESVWNFLRGVLKQEEHALSEYHEVIEFSEDLYNSGSKSPFLIAFLIDVYEELCLKNNENDEIRDNYAKKVFDLCESMSKKYDIIRGKYWDYVADRLRIKLKNLNENQNNPTDTNNGTANSNLFS